MYNSYNKSYPFDSVSGIDKFKYSWTPFQLGEVPTYERCPPKGGLKCSVYVSLSTVSQCLLMSSSRISRCMKFVGDKTIIS